MKSTGVIRKLDVLGRIVIPIEIRRNLGIDVKDSLEIFVDSDQILLKKYESSDIFTGETDGLIEYKGKKVSRESILEMAKIAGFIEDELKE